MNALDALPIVWSTHCIERVRLFPESRHRSRRIYKKLMKRHGAEFKERPAMYLFNEPMRGECLFVHPALKDELLVAVSASRAIEQAKKAPQNPAIDKLKAAAGQLEQAWERRLNPSPTTTGIVDLLIP